MKLFHTIDKVIPQIIVSAEPITNDEEPAEQIDSQAEQQILTLPQAKSNSPTLLTTVKRQ